MTHAVSLEHVDLATPDGTCDAYLAHPSAEGPWPGVLFIMDAIGWPGRRLAPSGCVTGPDRTGVPPTATRTARGTTRGTRRARPTGRHQRHRQG